MKFNGLCPNPGGWQCVFPSETTSRNRRNIMKKQIFSAALSTFFGLGVLAAAPQTQDQSNTDQHKESGHRHGADPERQVNTLSKKLNLTTDQKNQILPILTDRQKQMKTHP